MVIFIRGALDHRPEGQSYVDAVVEGSATRLRPKLMTVAAIVMSLLPVIFASGAGMEIMKPIAAPSIGGMVTSSLHVLFMTPCLFVIIEDIRRSGLAVAAPSSSRTGRWLRRRCRHGARGQRCNGGPRRDARLAAAVVVAACHEGCRAGRGAASTPVSQTVAPNPSTDTVYGPMDKDIRRHEPGSVHGAAWCSSRAFRACRVSPIPMCLQRRCRVRCGCPSVGSWKGIRSRVVIHEALSCVHRERGLSSFSTAIQWRDEDMAFTTP
jgi:hypothetical protein